MAWIVTPTKIFSRIISETSPHTMFFLAHEIPGVEGKLLRGEVLAIVAAIKTRLSLPTLSSHPIILVHKAIPLYSYGDQLWAPGSTNTSLLTELSRSLFFHLCRISMAGYSKLFSMVWWLISRWLLSSIFAPRKQLNPTFKPSCSTWQVNQLELQPRRCRCQWKNFTGFRLGDDGEVCCLVLFRAIFFG